jgi:hypothetical protein
MGAAMAERSQLEAGILGARDETRGQVAPTGGNLERLLKVESIAQRS